MKLHKTLCFMFVLVFIITASQIAWGQTENEKEQEIQKYIEEQEKLVAKIFKIKYTDAKELEGVLIPFLTRKGGIFGEIIVNEHFNTITIKDYPEKIAVIEEVIKQFDFKPEKFEFTVHLLKAADILKPEKPVPPVEPVPTEKPAEPIKPVPPVPPLPPDVEKVIEKLKTNFKYKNYFLLGTATIKNMSSTDAIARMSTPSYYYEINISWPTILPDSTTIKIFKFGIDKIRGNDRDSILRTSLLLDAGKPTVVGISTDDFGSKAFIIMLTGRILKE